MTRIIQRCFVVLAFTGILLSTAQETKVSEVSDSTTESIQTPTSAPENSFNSTDSISSSSHKVEGDENASFTEAATTESSLQSKSVATESSLQSKTTATDVVETSSKAPVSSFSESFTTISSTSASTTGNAHEDSDIKSIYNISNSDLLKAGLVDDSSDTEAFLMRFDSPSNAEEVSSDTKEKNQSEDDSLTNAGGSKITTEAAVNQPDDVTSTESISTDSGPSTVPSKEELVSDSSYVDKNQTPGDVISSAPSKVQSEETENIDTGNATHKSPNATNSIVSSTTVISVEETSPEVSASDSLKLASTPSKVIEVEDEKYSSTALPSEKEFDSIISQAVVENGESIVTTHDSLEAKIESSTHSINSDIPNISTSDGQVVESDIMVPESSSPAYFTDDSLPPFSSDALSIVTESIHPSKGFESAAQLAYIRHVSTVSPTPKKSSDLEKESEESVSKLQPPASLVTFDPDGMTHKYAQEPDSITFSPKVVNGKSTNSYLSKLKIEESRTNKPEGSHSSELERESGGHGLLPHDEPDREIPTSMHASESTKSPEQVEFTREPKMSGKVSSPTNDESEEMLNDSPHFTENRNKTTEIPKVEFTNKYLNKDLENNISNDITLASRLKSQDTLKSHHELDFPIDFQTQQSEIRPVTAVSPMKSSETALPISHNSQSPSNPTNADHPVEKTVSISPEMLPKDYIPPELLPKDYVTPKTLPVDRIPADMLPKDYVASEMPTEDNKPKETLSIPRELLPKDYMSSAKPSEDPMKQGMLPKDYVSPDLLPKDYVPSELLPKDYTPNQFEQGNNTDTAINSTIAGVAVKTSVSVSLPLSKSPNNTMSENSTNSLSKNTDTTPIASSEKKDNDGHLSTLTTENPTSSTIESTGFRILKPKLRLDSDDNKSTSTRTRKPFLPSLQKPSSTAGPPVSIFKQARTRIASITSSTTQRPFPQLSTIKIHYASRVPGMVPGGEMAFSIEPITTTVPTTTETEEPFSEEPFTGQTVGPVVPTEDNVTLLKVAGMIVVDKGLRWNEQLNNRLSPQYKEREKFLQSQLYRLFRTSPIAPQLWKIQIDGFSGKQKSRSVVIDFFLYLIKSQNEIKPEQLVTVFHEKLINNTFSRFTVDTNKTAFEFLNEELMRTTTPLPEVEEHEPVIPQWAIAVIVVGAASLIFIVLFAAVAILGRHHVRRRYSNKLTDEDSDRPSDWESKMAAAYENLAADTIYDVEDFHSDTYKKSYLVD